MARDVMAVRLHLAQIRVLEVVEDTPGALVVSVESTLLRLRCAQCGFKCHGDRLCGSGDASLWRRSDVLAHRQRAPGA